LCAARVPDLRQLRAFAAVARRRNFTRAASDLHLAQQAVSKSVAQLERELGVALLERTSREVRPTAAGEALLADAGPILEAADAAFERARAHGRGVSGTITVGATPALGSALLRDIARRLREDAPDLSVSFREVRPQETAAMLGERRADVVLARTARRAPGVEVVDLAPTAAALAVPEHHRLASSQAVDLSALDGERLMTWSPPGTPFTDLLLRLCSDAGAQVTPVETAVTGSVELVELAQLDAVAIVPEGSPPTPGAAYVGLPGVTLPLVGVRPAGAPAPAVARLLALLA
jgi:DNA-binding transcriptional LysR family regulator